MPEHTPEPTPPGPETTVMEPTPQGPASNIQIDAANASRPRPELLMTYTPEGPVVEEVRRQETDRKNADIDQQIEAFRQRMATQKDKARSSFEMASNYKDGREI